ncbi:Hypothetical protein CAP_4903 [Chondromyces apiculatus DSM 436]|uniref:Uncharacterized protein n=1 Tax=Chondromyces apiculatus DSM 436 TaxID=1192034 RepID=A0A017T474_9BACT|nr:Hypothetical protein CAP_4903 [Chondromyces apiculatus DSM 436]
MSRSLSLLTSGLSALAASLLALAACSDSLHLDPQPVPGSTSVGGGGQGGSGGSGAPCQSNSDCTYPTSICDTFRGECVGCLEHSDCTHQPGTICSEGACRCPDPDQSFCPAVPGSTESVYQTARCVDLTSASADCGSCGHACFGACTATGACADPWEPTSLLGAPAPRFGHVAVWAGERMIVWGGRGAGNSYLNSGGMYDPATRTWTATSTANAPLPRSAMTAVWTGSRMIVWGGENGGPLADGGSFDPTTNTWQTLPASTLSARYLHTAVWTDNQMIVWGGHSGTSYLGNGAAYNPTTRAWSAIADGSTMRIYHTAVWTGSSGTMVVFGGQGVNPNIGPDVITLDALGVFTPSDGGGSWSGANPLNPPSARYGHTAVFAIPPGQTGGSMFVWGGTDGAGNYLGDGNKYDVVGSGWTAMQAPAPAARTDHTAVWIGGEVNQMMVWGGFNGGHLDSGGLYDPILNTWRTDLPRGPEARSLHTAVVTSEHRMIIWGGSAGGVLNSGGVFDPAAFLATN